MEPISVILWHLRRLVDLILYFEMFIVIVFAGFALTLAFIYKIYQVQPKDVKGKIVLVKILKLTSDFKYNICDFRNRLQAVLMD